MTTSTITYLIKIHGKSFFGHDSITGNLTLDGAEYEAKPYETRQAAERDARFMVGAEVVER